MRRFTVPFVAAVIVALWGIAVAFIWLPEGSDAQRAFQLDLNAADVLTVLAGVALIVSGKFRDAFERVVRDRVVRRLSDALVISQRVIASQRRTMTASSRAALKETRPLRVVR